MIVGTIIIIYNYTWKLGLKIVFNYSLNFPGINYSLSEDYTQQKIIDNSLVLVAFDWFKCMQRGNKYYSFTSIHSRYSRARLSSLYIPLFARLVQLTYCAFYRLQSYTYKSFSQYKVSTCNGLIQFSHLFMLIYCSLWHALFSKFTISGCLHTKQGSSSFHFIIIIIIIIITLYHWLQKSFF